MPWRHCDAAIADDVPCPKCGVKKAAWTTEWNVTRTFRVSRKAAADPLVKLALVDANGDPVPGEPWEVQPPGAPPQAGVLDKYGYVKVVVPDHAAVEVTFPDRTEADFVAGGGDGPARFTVETDVKHTFQLLRRLRLVLLDEDLAPLGGVPFELVTEQGELRRLVSDAQGRAAADVDGPCLVRFPGVASPEPGEPPAPQGDEVRLGTREAARGVRLEPGRSVRLVLRAHHLAARLVDQAGQPVAGVPVSVRVTGPDRSTVVVTTAPDGLLRLGPLETGRCRLTLTLDGAEHVADVPVVDDAAHVVTVRLVRRAPPVALIVRGHDGWGTNADAEVVNGLLTRSGFPPAAGVEPRGAAAFAAARCGGTFRDLFIYYTGHGTNIETASPEAVLAALARARWQGARVTWIIDACGSGTYTGVKVDPAAFAYRETLPVVRVYAATAADGTAYGVGGGMFTTRLKDVPELAALDRDWAAVRSGAQWRGTLTWWIGSPFVDGLHAQRPETSQEALEERVRQWLELPSPARVLHELLAAEGVRWDLLRIVVRSTLRERALVDVVEEGGKLLALVDGARLKTELDRVVATGGSCSETWGPLLAERVRLLALQRREGRGGAAPPWGAAPLPVYDFVGVTPPITSGHYAQPTELRYERVEGTLFAPTLLGLPMGPPPADLDFVRPVSVGAGQSLDLYRGREPVQADDVKQGALADCYLLASLSAVARTEPETIRAMLHEEAAGVFLVRLRGVSPGGGDVVLRLDDRFPVTGVPSPFSEGLPYARVGDRDDQGRPELWPMLVEKAWALWRGGYRRIEGGSAAAVLPVITGRPAHAHPVAGLSEAGIAAVLEASLRSSTPTVLFTMTKEQARAYMSDHPDVALISQERARFGLGEISWHALSLSGREPGSRYTLRNPWGSGDPRPLTPAQIKKYFTWIHVCPR